MSYGIKLIHFLNLITYLFVFLILKKQKMRVIIENSYNDICNWVSLYIKSKINNHSKIHKNFGIPFVLGLPTGSTPLGVYKNLISYYKAGQLSFKNVVTFNMDEYVGLTSDHPQSYSHFMYENFFNSIDIPKKNINLLNGTSDDLQKERELYEKKNT